MSHTDKHRPTWVQLADETNPSWWKEETHNHEDGVCDIVQLRFNGVETRVGKKVHRYLAHRNHPSCFIWVSYAAWEQGLWGRGRGRSRTQLDRSLPWDGQARADLRRLKKKWLSTLDYEDIDSRENLPTRRWIIANHWWDWD